ncbi:MAG: ABC transporter substrate-binding protein [Erysipelothrix sp.]|nr:ABC transporter substrate-binding protein [Erysipelothrix sp.]
MKNLFKALSALLIIFALVACSADTGDVDSNVVAQGVTETEVLVANCAGTSGALSTVGVPFNAGIEAYFDMVNEAGGVNGRQIRFIHQDDEADPTKAVTCAQTMVEDEKIFAFVGHFYTGSIVATYDYITEQGVPMVYYASGVNTLFNEKAEGKDRLSFPVQPILITEGQVMVARAFANFEAKKIGMIYTNDDAGKDMLNGAQAKAAELGIEFVAEQVAADATDVSAAVTNILNQDVDVILGGSIQTTIPTIIAGLAAQNNSAPVITSYNNADGIVASQIYPEANGKFEVYASGWIDLTQEAAAQDLADFLANINPDHAGSAFATAGWIAGHFFTEGLKAVGEETLSWDNYVDALENATVRIPFGGNVDFKNGRRVGTDSMTLMQLGMAEGAEAPGWSLVYPLQNIEEILGS